MSRPRLHASMLLLVAAVACGDSSPTAAPRPRLEADPAYLEFGVTNVDASSESVTLVVINNGEGALAAPIIEIDGPGGSDFAVDSSTSTCPGEALPAGANCAIVLYFAPSAAGVRTATLTMRGSDDEGVSVPLTGTGAGLLTVARAGSGTGMVESTPAGIACGDACTGNFAVTVTLTATPDADSFFAAWSGACTGTGTCVVQPGESQTVTATFTRYPVTAFTRTPLPRSNRAAATWEFAAEGASSFECSLDDAPYAACTSPYSITTFGPGGTSTLRVRAVDAAGQRDPTPVESTVSLATGALLRYTFDGNATNTGALSGYDGTSGSATYPAGKMGQAIKFDGSAGTGTTLPGTAALLGSDHKWTIGLWFREDVAMANAHLLSFRQLGGWETYHGANSGNLTTCSPGGCFSFSSVLGTWRHLLFRYDGVSATVGAPLEIWVDGALVGTIANPESKPLTADVLHDITLGFEPFYGKHSVFYVDDVRIFNAVYAPDVQCFGVVGGTWTGTGCTLP